MNTVAPWRRCWLNLIRCEAQLYDDNVERPLSIVRLLPVDLAPSFVL